MQFLVDAQLPRQLAVWFTQKGFPAKHVSELGLQRAKDIDIWNVSKAEGYVIVSKDEDFSILSSVDSGGPALIWIRTGNTRTQSLIQFLEKLLPTIVKQLNAGDKIVEII